MRWQLPLGFAVVALIICVIVTVMATLAEPGAAMLNFLVIPMSGLLLWAVTWITWVTSDPYAMRNRALQTSLTGAAIGLGLGILMMVIQGIFIIFTLVIVTAAKSLGT